MKVLVLGPGGREHAIIRALKQDPEVTEVFAAPGNAGIATDVKVFPVDAQSPNAVVELAGELNVDLVVVGPEAPLASGVCDGLRDAGFDVFGPSKAAAQLESSKAFAKDVMAAAGVPTGGSVVATTEEEAAAALDKFGAPYVVKDDGLAAGKGVVVTSDRAEALAHANACFTASSQVVIEEFLDGPEVSLFVLSDGDNCLPLTPAQDFKRIFNNDEGPNTGGMGAYTPLDWLPENFVDEVVAKVAEPTIEQMRQRGMPFIGVLYCGLAVTAKGIQVIEFNARFGDPETQPVLARLKPQSGFASVLAACAQGNLAAGTKLQWEENYAVGVVLAAEGYPESPRKGGVLTGLDEVESMADVSVLHAGTAANEDGELIANGGRILSVVGEGASLAEAQQKAYAGIEKIGLDGGQYRTDIAAKAIAGQIVIPTAN
ncbi:phosphoribosylamine--glycine ligase [Micrococcoides hystricis]|uniref:Phosphoribosylamine--glycine ligase n=1 Tax=Micrococcoides hystricis TaxID=1572761 RepID=A0ABV6PDT1_9MICC